MDDAASWGGAHEGRNGRVKAGGIAAKDFDDFFGCHARSPCLGGGGLVGMITVGEAPYGDIMGDAHYDVDAGTGNVSNGAQKLKRQGRYTPSRIPISASHPLYEARSHEPKGPSWQYRRDTHSDRSRSRWAWVARSQH